jgi:uncharacterized membrane protein
MASLLALSLNASAEDRAIRAGESLDITVDLSFGEIFSYSWSSDVGVDFVLKAPSGTAYMTVTDSTSWDGFLPVVETGAYTLTWTNNDIVIAHLEFDVSSPFDEVEQAMSTMVWILIIAGIVLVSIVVIVVILVVMGGKKAPAQPQVGPDPQMIAQGAATGHCPTCGVQMDPNAAFCSKCGARFR